MRVILLIVLAAFLSACGYHGIPSEISTMHKQKRVIPIRAETIIIDAGHGRKDGGAISTRDRYEEKEFTLSTAFLIRDYLKRLGYKTVMTRSSDTYVPLSTRAEIANSLNADLFVSIHYNFSANHEAQGIEVFYYREGKKQPSARITQSKLLGSHVLKKIVSHTGAESRGVKQENFAVIRETRMPAILIEGGFLSNPRERARIRNPDYQHSLARGISIGIDTYLEGNRK